MRFKPASLSISKTGSSPPCNILFDNVKMRYVITTYNKDKEIVFLYEHSPINIYKMIRDSYEHIDLKFNYPSDMEEKKKEQLFKLLYETTSKKRIKNNVLKLIYLLG